MLQSNLSMRYEVWGPHLTEASTGGIQHARFTPFGFWTFGFWVADAATRDFSVRFECTV